MSHILFLQNIILMCSQTRIIFEQYTTHYVRKWYLLASEKGDFLFRVFLFSEKDFVAELERDLKKFVAVMV